MTMDRGSILAVVLGYAGFALLWIVFSDNAVEWLFTDPAKITLASSLKGGLFVVITAVLLYRLMRRMAGTGPAASPASPNRHHLGLPFALLVAAILALAGGTISHNYRQQRDTEVARLQAIADLRTNQISDWLQERLKDAVFVQNSPSFNIDYRRWQETGEAASLDRLAALLERRGINQGFTAVMLLDARGARLWGSRLAPSDIPAPLRDAVRQAGTDHKTRLSGPYRDQTGRMRLDFITPLKNAGIRPAVAVLEIDPTGWLYHTLLNWPSPSASGETLLFRRDGDQVLFLSKLRHLSDSAGKTHMPLATARLLAAQVLRGETSPGQPIEGEDYRRVAVLGVSQAIPGTDWFLIAKMDRAELYRNAGQHAVWIGLSGILALFTAATGFYLLRQRQQFAIAAGLRQSQEARLRTLHLLTAITDSSDDAIYAKDLAGRYILFNRAASRFVGKPADEVLGQDDRALFPSGQAEMLMAADRLAISENRSLTREESLDTPGGARIFLATKGPLHDADGKVIGSFGISRDITERNRAEQALRESEATYRSLFEHMMNGYAYCRMLFENGEPTDFIYLDVNRAFEQQTGLHDVAGHNVSEVIPGIRDSDPRLFEAYGRVALGGPPEHFEIHVEAMKMWFSISVYCPRPEHFVVVFDVITERKQAEAALRESENRYRALVEQTLAGIYIIQDGRFAYVNPAFARMFGYDSADELIDRVPTSDLISTEDRAKVAENVRRRIEGEVTDVQYSFVGLRRDGSRLDVEVHGRAFEYRGHPAVIGFILDITDRKAAEADLRLRNEELRRFNRATVGRELDMIELKKEINALSRRFDLPPPYPLDFIDPTERTPPDSRPTEGTS